MNNIECKKISSKIFRGKMKKIVDNQIDTFFEIEKNNNDFKHNYEVGDSVNLNKYNYLHGIGSNNDIVDFISKNGILSRESTGNFGNHAFQFVVGLWRVNGDITLKEYVENYSGIVAKVNDKNYQVPYKKIDEFVEKLKDIDHWKWTSISSMEIRFMPSLARNINQVGFILNMKSDYAQKLLLNDINSECYDKKVSDKFLRKDLRNKFWLDVDNDFLERASYIIFGINKCFIERIIVGRDFENNKEKIEKLKKLFPNSYICNLEGIVIAK